MWENNKTFGTSQEQQQFKNLDRDCSVILGGDVMSAKRGDDIVYQGHVDLTRIMIMGD